MAAKCPHEDTVSLYRRAPRSDGGGFLPDARRCVKCLALLERQEGK